MRQLDIVGDISAQAHDSTKAQVVDRIWHHVRRHLRRPTFGQVWEQVRGRTWVQVQDRVRTQNKTNTNNK
jgi:hypothetical protein